MTDVENAFFGGKRDWSYIKDRILGSYMYPYINKIKSKGHRILFIDAFAGPGKFDGGEPGSPLLICSAAKKLANDRFEAIFINREKKYHELLSSILIAGGYHPNAIAIHADSMKYIQENREILKKPYSIFLYLDPFGLSVPFEVVELFLQRNRQYSTEIIVNLCAPVLHRLAGRNAENIDRNLRESRHSNLTKMLGGDYWKEALLSPNIPTKDREHLVVEGYIRKLSENGYLVHNGYCPIQASRGSSTKYYMIFASPHRDSIALEPVRDLESGLDLREKVGALRGE
jgi:three-Cys-motif partner protein